MAAVITLEHTHMWPGAVAGLDDLAIETPSWAYANSGTRFKVFAQKGVPRDPFEKIADAAQVHAFTGAAPTVALHIPWDSASNSLHGGRRRRGRSAGY